MNGSQVKWVKNAPLNLVGWVWFLGK